MKAVFRRFKMESVANEANVRRVRGTLDDKVYEIHVGNILLLLIQSKIVPSILTNTENLLIMNEDENGIIKGYSRSIVSSIPIVSVIHAVDMTNDALDRLFPNQWIRILDESSEHDLKRLYMLELQFNANKLDEKEIYELFALKDRYSIKQSLADKNQTYTDAREYVPVTY